jgi:hypothetical protein
MDLSTLFAILLAFAVDFIVVILALAAGRLSHDANLAFERAEKDALKRIRRVSLDDPKRYQEVLDQNIERLRAATQYANLFAQILADNVKAHTRIKLIRGQDPSEGVSLGSPSDSPSTVGALSHTDRLREKSTRPAQETVEAEFDSVL